MATVWLNALKTFLPATFLLVCGQPDPKITSTPVLQGQVGVLYQYDVNATGIPDPSYDLVSGPSWMGIDSRTGMIQGTPTEVGSVGVTVRAFNGVGSGDIQSYTINVTSMSSTLSIWSPEVTVGPNNGTTYPFELGVKFRADVNGYIIEIRFYKYPGNTGTHIGNLWTTAGTNLGQVMFTDETASGWQQANFATPIPITANTTYIASCHFPNAHFANSAQYFTSTGVDNPPLHALRSGVDGANGVYRYGSTTGFPNQSWEDSNYWVDVAFVYNVGLDHFTFGTISGPQTVDQPFSVTITARDAGGNTYAGYNGQATLSASSGTITPTAINFVNGVWTGQVTIASAGSGVTITATGGGATSSSSAFDVITPVPNITSTPVLQGQVGVLYQYDVNATGIPDPSYELVSGPTCLGINSTSGMLQGTPTAADSFNVTVRAVNTAGSDTQSFTINVTSLSTALSIWSPDVTVGPDNGSSYPFELGVKFRADVNGYITGIRFYKHPGSTGTHIGNLWKTDGTNLGQVTFTGETASGWQQANFATPIPITANTTYIASCHFPNAHFANSAHYFTSMGVDNPPLHALRNGVDGPNGVYRFSSTTGFPDQTWEESNYWVDVAFVYNY